MAYYNDKTFSGNAAGPRSKFTVKIEIRVDNSRCTDTQAYIQYKVWMSVVNNNNNNMNFTSGNGYTTWAGNGKTFSTKSGNYFSTGWKDYGLKTYGSTVKISHTAKYQGGSGTWYKSTCTASYAVSALSGGNLAPLAPTNVRVSRNASSPSYAVGAWTNKATTGRPCNNTHVRIMTLDDQRWRGLPSDDTLTKRTTASYNFGRSENWGIRFAVRSKNSIGYSAYAFSAWFYAPIAAPTKITPVVPQGAGYADVTVNHRNGTEIGGLGIVVLEAMAPGGSWTAVGSATMGAGKTSATFRAPYNGVRYFRAYCKWNSSSYGANSGYFYYGSASSPTAVATVTVPAAVSKTVANYVLSGSYYLPQQAKLTLTLPAPTANNARVGVRTGIYYAVLTGGSWAKSGGALQYVSTATSAANPSLSLTFNSFADKAVVFSASGYNNSNGTVYGPESPVSNVILGRASAPSISASRGRGSIALVYTAHSQTGAYASEVVVSYRNTGDASWKTKVIDGSRSQTVALDVDPTRQVEVSAVRRPTAAVCASAGNVSQSRLTSAASTATWAKCPLPPGPVSAISKDGDKMTCVATWERSGDDPSLAVTYHVYVVTGGAETLVGTVAGNGSGEYSLEFAEAEIDPVKIAVVASYLSGSQRLYSSPSSTDYQYVPDELQPPTLLFYERDLSGDGTRYKIFYRDAWGGYPYVLGDSCGYRYRFFIDSRQSGYQSPSDAAVVEVLPEIEVDGSEKAEGEGQSPAAAQSYHATTIELVNPKPVFVRAVAVDRRSISAMSNSLRIAHTMPGVGVYIYDSPDVSIDDCIIEGSASAIVARGGESGPSGVKMSNCRLEIIDALGEYYNLSTDGSFVNESFGSWETGI